MTRETFDQGMAMRTADAFSRPMRERVTEYCRGAVWIRPDRETAG